jgi:hypothetical protein
MPHLLCYDILRFVLTSAGAGPEEMAVRGDTQEADDPVADGDLLPAMDE